MISTSFRQVFNKTSKFWIKNRPSSRKFMANNVSKTSTNVPVFQPKKEKDLFIDALPSITDAIVTSPKLAANPEVGAWLKKALEYNLSGGKMSRGLTTVLVYQMLEKPENLTEESMHLARVLGWCVEMLQSYFVVLDDIMDGSTTRRGQPCWYTLSEVGLGVINDSILMHMALMQVLKDNLRDKPCYVDVIELFNEATMTASIGHHLDLSMAHRNKNDYSLFTIERHNTICKNKTAYYSFLLPVRLGFYLCGKTSTELHNIAEGILLDIGLFFQIQDDFLDCFGDESVTGKKGTDIQEGKCSWLAVQALQRCSGEQRALFERNYGRADAQCVQRVKRLYEDLQLPDLYRRSEQAAYDDIVHRANALPKTSTGESVSPNLFILLLDMIYKRKQ